MFCEQCGFKLDKSNSFCDECGNKNELGPTSFPASLSGFKNIGNYKTLNGKVVLSLVVVIIGGVIFYTQNQIKQQRQLTVKLENQINAVKEHAQNLEKQDEKSKQEIINELNTQKVAAAEAQKQAQEAKAALALVKNQQATTVPVNNNSFPTINTRAIVLVVCFDTFGNITQSGSGTIVNSNGNILTNRHVVTDSSGNSLSCAAVMNDGSVSPALQTGTLYYLTLNGYYPNFDAALLTIAYSTNTQTGASVPLPASFPYISPKGGNLKQGDHLYIFGYPGASNLQFNVTQGIVSSLPPDGVYINTDAVIDHGNSGGAAITSDGRFVGIPTRKYVSNGDYLGQVLNVNNLNVP